MYGDSFGPRARNSLGEMICLNCGTHRAQPPVNGSGHGATCSLACRAALMRRGGRMGWREFRLRVAEVMCS